MPRSAIALDRGGVDRSSRVGIRLTTRSHGLRRRFSEEPSAICDRPALCTQRNNTTGLVSELRPSDAGKRSEALSGEPLGHQGSHCATAARSANSSYGDAGSVPTSPWRRRRRIVPATVPQLP